MQGSVFNLPVLLIARKESFETASARLAGAGWKHVTLTEAIIDTHPVGCSRSHLAAVKQGIELDTYPFFIFEEDAWPTAWQRDVSFPDADAIRLDLSVWGWDRGSQRHFEAKWEPTDNADWIRVRNMLAATALGIANPNFARAYASVVDAAIENGEAHDVSAVALYQGFAILALRWPLVFQGPESNHNAEFTDVVIPQSSQPTHRVVIVVLTGGPGTQMFQYAHGLAVARKCQADLQLVYRGDGSFALDRFGLHLTTDVLTEQEAICIEEYGPYRPGLEDEIVSRILESENRVCYLHGYFQNERLFSGVSIEVRDLFGAKRRTPESSPHACPVGVHVYRRGSLESPQDEACDSSYYLTAMRIVKSLIEKPCFLIFTDEPDWCRSAFPAAPNIQIRQSCDAYADFEEMLGCAAFIISSGTLSWWAAWLNGSEVVICPAHTVRGVDWPRMPERWVQIPCTGVSPVRPLVGATNEPVFKQIWWDRNMANRWDDYFQWTGDAQSPSRVAIRHKLSCLGIKTILDCGCGYGIDSAEMQQVGPDVRYSGMDASSIFVEFAQARGLDVRFGYAESMPYDDSSFDLVYFRHVLEHLPGYQAALTEALRVSRRYVAIVWYLPPTDEPDRFFYDPDECLHQNTYNLAGLESFINSLNPAALTKWERVGDRESILWIDSGGH